VSKVIRTTGPVRRSTEAIEEVVIV